MRARFPGGCLSCILLAAQAFGAEPPPDEEAVPQKPVVLVFDFRSAHDGDRVGKFVANNIIAKLDKSGRCVLLDRADVTEAVTQAKFVARFDDKPGDLLAFAGEKLGATHVVWGKVEPVGAEGLKVFARAASSADKGDRLAVDAAVEIKNQYEVQAATKEIVRLFLNIALPEPELGPAEEERWQTGPNLVKNPGFETGRDAPDFWEAIGKEHHHGGVAWVASPEGKGKCIRFQMDEAIAGTYGIAYYSDPISIKDGRVYRFSVRVRSDGPTVKIFLKHYRFFPPGPNEKEGQWRETRRAPLNCKGQRGQWETFTRDFHPHRDDAHDPEMTRIALYAYWPKGTVYFDDVVMKKLK